MSLLHKLFTRSKKETDGCVIPPHIAIIMDGNGRWAKKRGLSRNMGHREGSNTLKKIVKYCSSIGVKNLTVYAFSTENWKRPKDEVESLMELLTEYLKKAERELAGKDVRIRVIGDIEGMPVGIQQETQRVVTSTRNNPGMCLNIALNYGSRAEIVKAVLSIARDLERGKLSNEDINESSIAERLYTAGIPEPDLVIRTSGEKRLSNFLLWQSAYSEFWYTNVLWPDFTEQHLMEAIMEYSKRNRRFGGI